MEKPGPKLKPGSRRWLQRYKVPNYPAEDGKPDGNQGDHEFDSKKILDEKPLSKDVTDCNLNNKPLKEMSEQALIDQYLLPYKVFLKRSQLKYFE